MAIERLRTCCRSLEYRLLPVKIVELSLIDYLRHYAPQKQNWAALG
jgi:hypothetical protein